MDSGRCDAQVFGMRGASDCERAVCQLLHREVAMVFPDVDAMNAKGRAVLIGGLTARYLPIGPIGVFHLHGTVFCATAEHISGHMSDPEIGFGTSGLFRLKLFQFFRRGIDLFD